MINEELELQETLDNLVKDCKTYSENMNRLDEAGVEELNEGLWEKIKYGLSKLGRYKAGGKIMGKGKVDANAAAQIKAIVDKKGNELIKALDAKIKESNPKFPNNEKEQEFLQTIVDISTVYDSIVNATKLSPKDKGFLPVDVANGVIEDLAAYVKKYLDIDLTAVYSTMDEQVEEAIVHAGATGSNPTAPPAAPLAAKDVRTQLQGKVGADATTRDSQRMDTLKSNKLPLVLAGVGTALGALGWLAQTPWMQNLLTNMFGSGTPAEDAIYKTVSGGKPDAEGMVHWMSQIDGKPVNNLGDIGKFIQTHGAENVSHMFDGNGSPLSPMEQVQKLQEFAKNAPNDRIVDIFQKGNYIGNGAGNTTPIYGDMKLGRNTFGISMAAKFVSKVLVKQAVKAGIGAGAGVAASVAGVGSVLVPLGIGLIGAGALVKLMRMKGQKQSRAKTLNDLFQSLQPLKGTPENTPVVDVTDKGGGNVNPAGAAGGDGQDKKKGGASTDDLYNQLKKFFQFVKNNENVMGGGERRPAYANKEKPQFPRTNAQGKPQMPLPEEEAIELSEGRYIQDKRTLQFLNKQMGSFDKIAKFEEFLTRLETIRNIVRKMNNTGDKVLDGFLAKLRNNPIMAADFSKLFNAAADDPKAVNSLRYFIEDMLKSLYSGQFKFMNIIDKIGTLGSKGNINKLEEAEKGYNIDNPTKPFQKDVLTKETFKKNLISFVSELVNIFQYLDKKRGQVAPKQPVKGAPKQPVKEVVNEQLEKMKHLMKF